MPADLIHRIGIAAPAERIYRAIDTEEVIKAWWTTDVKMDANAGGEAVFFDYGCGTFLRMPALHRAVAGLCHSRAPYPR